MTNRDIPYLLNKYKTKQPHEKFTSQKLQDEYGMKKWRMNQKIRTTKIIMNQLNIQGTSRDRCLHIIKNVPLKELHRNASCETIITAICFYVKKTENSNIKIEDYTVCKENNLNYQNFSLILCRLCDHYQKQ